MSQCGPFVSINSGWICRVVWACASFTCACHVDLEFADMPAPLETCWHTSCRYTCTHIYTHWSPPSSASVPRPLAPRGLSVSDAGDSGASRQGCWGWIRVFNMRSRSSCAYILILGGLPGPLFLSFPGSGGHSSPRPWLESSNSRLCQKMACAGLRRATPSWPLIRRDEALTQWLMAWSVSLIHRIVHNMLVNAKSCLYKAKLTLTAL